MPPAYLLWVSSLQMQDLHLSMLIPCMHWIRGCCAARSLPYYTVAAQPKTVGQGT